MLLPWQVTAAVANFYVPTLSMLYIYGRIFCTIRQRGRSNHLGQINTGSSSTRSWKLTSLRTHRASNTAHRVNSAGSKASVAGALPANPPAVQSAAAASAATSSAAAAAAKSKNCDDSSDTISINTEDQRSTKARHWRPRFNRIISATCGGKKKTGIRWYRRVMNNMAARCSMNVLTCHVYDRVASRPAPWDAIAYSSVAAATVAVTVVFMTCTRV